VQTDSGPALASVLARPAVVMTRQPAHDQGPRVLRRATGQDQALRARHEQREREAFRLCVMKIRERGLAMKLARVEQLFDGSRLVFFFTSEERVDFRELVRELASEFKTRIELRQIGVRDEARLLSGYGTCGRRSALTPAAAPAPRDDAYPGSAGEFPAAGGCPGGGCCGSGCCR